MADHEEQLRNAGLRVTRPRMAVLEAVADHPHGEADEIIVAVRARAGQVSHQAVYDSLNVLSDRGVLRRIQPRGGLARYESRVGDNHHHLVCRACGAIEDVDCAVGETPCLTPVDDHGYHVDEAEVIYWGICAMCRTGIESG